MTYLNSNEILKAIQAMELRVYELEAQAQVLKDRVQRLRNLLKDQDQYTLDFEQGDL